MNKKDFDTLVAGLVLDVIAKLNERNSEYNPGEDKLNHFKQAADKRNKAEPMHIHFCRPHTPESCLLGMKLKHDVDVDFMVDRIAAGVVAPLDRWKEKVLDRIVYNILMFALVTERMIEKVVIETVEEEIW